MVRIREELAADQEAIRQVNRAAFEGEDEAVLVDRLRSEGLFITSLVAEEAGEVAGHILFTKLPIKTDRGEVIAAGLAPMAVLPGLQRQGVGSKLVEDGLNACRERGYGIAIVLGHPEYYPRFGFTAALTRNLQSPFSGSDAFMATELTPGALDGVQGTVHYPEAFGVGQ